MGHPDHPSTTRGDTLSEPLLTLDEFAAILRVSRRTVERLVKKGRVRVVHPSPGRTAVTRAEVKAYLAILSRAA